jgi:hypothetical protein
VRTDGADRVEDPWERLLSTPGRGADLDVDDDELEAALLAYKQQKAARWGAERFAAELRRRDEAEEHRQVWTGDALAAPVEASVEAQVVDGEPAAFRPEPPRIGFDPRFVVTPLRPSVDEARQGREHVAALDDVELVALVSEEVVAAEVETEAVEPEAVVPVDVDVPVDVAVPEEPAVAPRAFAPDQPWSAGTPVERSKRLPAALRHPNVPRPPAQEPTPQVQPKRRWRGKRAEPAPVRVPVISAPEWARMSPGARRLYGFEESEEQRRAG